MKALRTILIIIGAITSMAAVAAGVFTYMEHQKSEEELEHYLDCSIQ